MRQNWRYSTLLAIVSHHEPDLWQVFREIHASWMQQTEEQRDPGETEEHRGSGGEDMVTADASAEVDTPVAFLPQDLPTAEIGIEIPSSILQDIASASALYDTGSSSEAVVDASASPPSSPALSISTISDLTPTELGEIEQEQGQGQAASHDSFYFEDGNVEIVCRDTAFRVHSTIVSFSSSQLREILSQPAPLNAPTPGGRPRITISDSPEDFTILLKMIYTPGRVPPLR